MKRGKKWLALLLVGMMAIPQVGVYAEELTDGFAAGAEEKLAVDYSFFDDVIENEIGEIDLSEDIEEIDLSEDIEEITDDEFSEDEISDLVKVEANSLVPTITGWYNSSKGGDIRWNKILGATGYVLYRNRQADGLKKVATITDSDITQYIDEGIRNNCWGRVYTYYVRPLYGSIQGIKSESVTLQRLAPMEISKCVSDTPGQASLTWACTVKENKALGYEIQYAKSKDDLYGRTGSFKKETMNGRNKLVRNITGLTNGQTYYFRIRCYVNYTHSVTGVQTRTWSQYSEVKSVKIKNSSISGNYNFSENDIEKLIAEARAQYEREDYTQLSSPVLYKILWIGFTHVSYGKLDFQMTDFDKNYLKAVALNFEKTVERIVGGSLDITIDLYFVDTKKGLTYDDDGWLFLAQETVQSDINRLGAGKGYDSVLTTVQTAGDENHRRNANVPEYGSIDVILGLKTAGLEDDMGYSTINLGEPDEGTYPLRDPSIPSLYATAVSVHEWMHQLEYMGELLGIEYPDTHAYIGPAEYPGYQKYTANLNNYDFFEFYELVLKGKLPYTRNGSVKHVGMYPRMWRLAKRDVRSPGVFTIRNRKGEYLYGKGDGNLTLSKSECRWIIEYVNNGGYALILENDPELRIDLSNAWDEENNRVGLFVNNPDYLDAQRWLITDNNDGSWCIRTGYGSGRAISIDSLGGEAQIRTTGGNASEAQRWIFTKVGY